MENFSDLHGICINIFDAVSKTTLIFVLPLFMLRIAFANISGNGSQTFAAIKGALIYFCLITAFPLIVETLFSIPEAYLPKYESMSTFFSDAPDDSYVTYIPFALDKILSVIEAVSYWIAYYIHVLFFIGMCSVAPLVFLCSALLGVGLGLELFMGLLIVGSSWPIIWYGFDQVHTFLTTKHANEFGARCLAILLTFFKGLAPSLFAALIVKSPAGKVATGAIQKSVAGSQWAIKKVRGSSSNSKDNANNKSFYKSRISAQKNGSSGLFKNKYSPNSKNKGAENNDQLKKARSKEKNKKEDNKNENT